MQREFAKRHEHEEKAVVVHEIEQVHLPVHSVVQTVIEHPVEHPVEPHAVVVDHFYDPHYAVKEQYRPKLHIDAKKEESESKDKDFKKDKKEKKEPEMHKEKLHMDYGTSSTDSEIGKEMTPFEYHQAHHVEPEHHTEPVH